ncbi:MAG: dienelactone hydrolase family protein [Candidatus Eisenbacteria bacterium]|nr:dienelactone hydrolase family protein [Candidatus Eisenbacteria bacterium]
MERQTAHDFDQELLALFDAYVHGVIDRRTFLDRAGKFAVAGVTAAMLLEQLSPKFAEAQVVKPADARITAGYLEYDSPRGSGRMRGYLKSAKIKYERHLYPGTQHGFNNDTTPRYDVAAATLAWERTTVFFKKNVR